MCERDRFQKVDGRNTLLINIVNLSSLISCFLGILGFINSYGSPVKSHNALLQTRVISAELTLRKRPAVTLRITEAVKQSYS